MKIIKKAVISVFIMFVMILFSACVFQKNGSFANGGYNGDYAISVIVIPDENYSYRNQLMNQSFQSDLFEAIYHDAYINTILAGDNPCLVEEFIPTAQPKGLDKAEREELFTDRMTQILNHLGNGNNYPPGTKSANTGSLVKAISMAAGSLKRTGCNHKMIIILEEQGRNRGKTGLTTPTNTSSGEVLKDLVTAESVPDLSGITIQWYD